MFLFFCLYWIDIVEIDRKAEQEGEGRHTWIRLKPGPLLSCGHVAEFIELLFYKVKTKFLE